MLSFFHKKNTEKLFLTLSVCEGTVATALWSASSSGIVMIKYSSPVIWNHEVEASLIEASDSAFEELGVQANAVKEVLLGLPDAWAQNQSIAVDKKVILKKLTDQLNLKSVGFVISMEAIVALFREQKKLETDSLLLFVSKCQLQLMSIIQGVAGEIIKVDRSGSLVHDILEGVGSGSDKPLPPRILLVSQDYTGQEFENLGKELEIGAWEEASISHPPKVEALPATLILEAVSLCGGKEVAKVMGIINPRADDMSLTPPPSSSGFSPVKPPTDEPHLGEDKTSSEQLPLGVHTPVTHKFSFRRKYLLLFFVFLITCLGITSVFGLRALMNVSLSVVIETKQIEFDADLTVDASAAQTDPQNNILKAELRSREITDTAQGITTGVKEIGDKATGQVTIYNRTTVGARTFKAGTVIKLDDKVQFVLDSDVTVPAGTSETEYVGKASVKVTATNIGAASNLDKGVELVVGTFDKASFVAKTDDVFTGGSSRNIQVVSQIDQKKLSDTLYAQLKTRALETFTQTADPNENIILSDQVKIKSKLFSDEVGKEVKSFTLTMVVETTAIVYTNQDLALFATQKLAEQIPSGAQLQPERTLIEVNTQEVISDTKTKVGAKIISSIIPAFDGQQIAKVLAGKNLEEARRFLDAQTSISTYTLRVKPALSAKLFNHLPQNSQRIFVTSQIK